ncbi:MAG: hypothetical protein V1936_05125 [Patescibacteria group bacterium]
MSEILLDDDLAEIAEFGVEIVHLEEHDYPEDGEEHKFDMKHINRVSRVFRDPEKMRTAFESDGVVRCMDGGTEGGLRMAGSGILLPRAQLALPKNHPMADFFREFGIELTGESEAVLLPNDYYLGILRKSVEKKVIRGISAHAECGAANLDLGEIFKKIGVSEDVVKRMISDPRWQSVVDAHAKFFSETLAKKLNLSPSADDWIPIGKMSRKSHKHVEEAFYIDLIGGTRPGVAFDSSKLVGEVPNGFTIHPAISDWENVFHRIEISLDIAKVGHRFSVENPFVIFIINDPAKGKVAPEFLNGIKKAVQKFGKHVIIKQVTPNFGD